jgi:hypothetical protein
MQNVLDLNEYGVTQMQNAEMVQTEGGIVPLLVCGALLLLAGCVAPREVGTSTDKMDSTRNANQKKREE